MNQGIARAHGARMSIGGALLAAFGAYAVVLGTVNFLAGGFMVLAGGPATERHFIGHITEAHASTLIGLGFVSWAACREAAGRRGLYPVMALANIVGFFVVALSAPTAERGSMATFLTFSQLFWGLAFLFIHSAEGQESGTSGRLGWSSIVGSASLFSFSVLVVASGLVWVLAPMKFATAAAGQLAGASAAFAGQTRGVSDIAIGVLAWAGLARHGTPLRRPLLAGLLIANVLLVVAGLLAQYSVLYTPTRWVVEGLHIIWSVGFAWTLLRPGSATAPAIDSGSGMYRNTTDGRGP